MKDLLHSFASLDTTAMDRPYTVGQCFDAIIQEGSPNLKPNHDLSRPKSVLALFAEYSLIAEDDKEERDTTLTKFLRYLEFYCKDFSLDPFKCLQYYKSCQVN